MKPHRVQLSRKKGWRMPENTISVARPGKWGNPFSVMPDLPPGTPVDSRGSKRYVAMPSVAEAVAAYRRWVTEDPAGQALLAEAKTALRGHHLACWCPLDGPCHAGVLLELVNE
ncbi:DUF4326 domain-containing protein [Massilia sp. ST3]|uniref:DUF4326 domain-containing protein n=1 Tax=Massilia sp. ST3 TaxID=2824903 RepID=UPI001B83A3E8|nr:DUF4326 domain-containing protein [Massilia sp. ST3]MBQ5949138.1 DUF4326 domain-containing protein [Massilia sp. ST3]